MDEKSVENSNLANAQATVANSVNSGMWAKMIANAATLQAEDQKEQEIEKRMKERE